MKIGNLLKIENWKLKINRSRTVFAVAVLLIVSSVVTLFPIFHKPASVSAAWYSDSGIYWNYRKMITIDHTKVGTVNNTDQADFPVLVKFATDVQLAANAQDDGDDILFTSSNETTKLSHEIEKFDGATGELVAWVKIPLLSHTDDTIIYLYYGNALATGPSAVEEQATWSNGYVGAWHMNSDSGETGSASTSYDLTETGTVEMVDGKINKARSWPSNGNNHLSKTDAAGLDGSANFTVSGWIYYTGGDNLARGIVSKRVASSNQASYSIFRYTNGKLTVYFPESGYSVISTSTINASNWYYFSLSYDGTRADNLETELYINGLYEASGDAQDTVPDTTSSLYVGILNNAYATSWLGSIDDIKLATATRSADWIATEYANQNSPSTFYQLDTEVIADAVAPSNPNSYTVKNILGGSTTLTSGNFYNYPTPYFEWPAAEAAGGAHDTGSVVISGVAGYYLYFGTSCGGGGGDPAISRGVLSDTGGGLHYQTGLNFSVPDLTTNEGTYCLRVKTKDNANNVSDTSEVFEYKYEVTVPNAPTFISSNPAGYSSNDLFDFTWPVATDNVGGSGIAGYQYKRGGTSGDDWSATISTSSINNILSYQTGENIFYVRSVDNAGNTSVSVQTTYYYSNEVPTKPTSLTAIPELLDVNSFAFSWTAPVHARPIVDYGYSVNATPTTSNLTWKGNNTASLATDHFATLQGINTLYLVAKDDSGAYGIADASVASVTFTCQTVAPPIPTTVSVTDSSDRLISRYMLTLQWVAGAGQDPASFAHYSIERSIDNITFTEIATSTSTAYIDTSLNNSTTYYYRIKAVDNAGSPSVASTTVSKMPTGKFDSPPSIISEPTVAIKSTSATISWVVNRTSSSAVRFGTSETDLSRSQLSATEETNHSFEIVGLEPSTRYFYQVQSLDSYRDYSLESAYSVTYHFDTPESPSIANVSVSNITLTSSDISWETSTASNTRVLYGTSISYGAAIPEISDSMTTKHAVKLINLSHSSRYHFKIYGNDSDNNILSSDDYVFDTLPMPTISTIGYQPDFSGPAPAFVISWITNVPTSSSVEYSPKESTDSLLFEESQSALVVQHNVILSNLQDSTDYNFQVKGTDQFGNTTLSDIQILKTGLDSRAPKISNIIIESSNIGSNSEKAQLVVSWETDENSTSQVEYGLGLENNTAMKKSISDPAPAKKHLVIITNLDPSSPYHLRVISSDQAGNTATSENLITTTGSVQKNAFAMILYTLSTIFGWLGKVFQ